MSNIGIPTWVFQVQPRNSEAGEPTTVCNRNMNFGNVALQSLTDL